jgi:hypothetical protein
MKKIKKNYAVLLIATVVGIYACGKITDEKVNTSQIQQKTGIPEMVVNIIQDEYESLHLPTGVYFEQDESSITVFANNEVQYIGVTGDGGISRLSAGGSVTESCSGCAQAGSDGATDCTTSGGVPSTGVSCSGGCSLCIISGTISVGSQVDDISTGGFINTSVGIDYAEPSNIMPPAFNAMYEVDIVQNGIAAFYSNIYTESAIPEFEISAGNITAPKDHDLVLLNIFGRAAVGIVPTKEALLNGSIVIGSAQCVCLDGEELCNSTALIPGILTCDVSDQCGLDHCNIKIMLASTVPTQEPVYIEMSPTRY